MSLGRDLVLRGGADRGPYFYRLAENGTNGEVVVFGRYKAKGVHPQSLISIKNLAKMVFTRIVEGV